jgi:predicted kinase
MAVELVLPDPCLVVLVGPAGAGKTMLAARHFAPNEVLSSDAFRARVGGREDDQAVTGTAFGALHAVVRRRLEKRLLTVVDATNVQRHARLSLLRRAAAATVPAVAIVLDIPEEDCLAGDRSRPGRHVDPAVIHRQWLDLQEALQLRGGLLHEGFASVGRLTDRAEVDALIIRRDPTR